MFRFDLTTVRTTPLTKLVWPACEDVGGLRVLGSAPTWILDVVADATDDDPSPRRYLFCELSDVLEIGLGQPWVFRELHLLTAVQAVRSSGSALLLVNAIWVCEAARGRRCFEIVGATGSRYLDDAGHFVFHISRRLRQLWPVSSEVAFPSQPRG